MKQTIELLEQRLSAKQIIELQKKMSIDEFYKICTDIDAINQVVDDIVKDYLNVSK